MSGDKFISIRGAHANNLKGVDVRIPRDSFTVITGLSGSGKTSLAFDTIYAEGQRRYMNTLSPYARHFMGIPEKPAVESIEGLSPIIAIEQKTTASNPRSTVGTVTEVSDFLRLLFSRASTAYSPVTGKPMVRYTDSQIVELIMQKYDGRKCLLLSPLVRGRKGHYRDLFDNLRRKGFTEVRIDSEIMPLLEVEQVDRYKPHFIELVIDKLKPCADDIARVRNSVSTALSMGKGSIAMLDFETGELAFYSKHLVDPESGVSLQDPAPHFFSFNSPEGYCPHCKGLGMIADTSIESIIPDRSLSLSDGGIIPLGKVREGRRFDVIRSISRKYNFSLFDPIEDLSDEVVSLLVYGSEEYFRIGEGTQSEMVCWEGVLEDVERKVVCPVCHGSRLRGETDCFRLDGKTISEVSAMELGDLFAWLKELPSRLSHKQAVIAADILKELDERVRFLLDVGLEYLTLDRPAGSLSGGESQRIRLATQIGSRLVNVIYILDEPSIGLHCRDNRKLIASLKKLRDEGNTVVVVEHDAETMRSADWIVDVGPGAGENGGKICFSGPSQDAPLLAESGKAETQRRPRRAGNGSILGLRGCTGNNLKNVDVDFPLGCLVGVAGVSGSGKSTLVNETLMPLLKDRLMHAKMEVLPYREVVGMGNVDKVVEVDQSPIGKTPRSNPATYTGVFDDIRALFEQTPDAKVRGFKAGRFSFNVPGGRCEECKGAGVKLIEMNFLPSVSVVCDACGGRRYKEDTLAVRYKGKTSSEVLEMPVSQACEFFQSSARIAPKLKALVDVGLGYIHLGQAATTLSGGESQRMKLASELQKKSTGNTLYILDEPTTGLHEKDIRVLMDVLHKLVDQGNTVIVIEHNLDVLKEVDYLIDMGPEGGDRGGRIVSAGTPEQVACDPASVTGPYLKEVL
ncbi:MAG: excinuclease ABC subunit UvrA [Bacteroidales bacterium]|nr:excinuclease ABC subunit UvrA [Bacteroidales bacterium]